MLHYYAAEFFAPVIVTYYITYTDLKLYIVSDKLYPIPNITLEVNLYAWNDMKPIQSHTYSNIIIVSTRVPRI